MDDRKHSISLDALHARLCSEAGPILVDVRCDTDFAAPTRWRPERFIARWMQSWVNDDALRRARGLWTARDKTASAMSR